MYIYTAIPMKAGDRVRELDFQYKRERKKKKKSPEIKKFKEKFYL